jgi:hypothetical protein
MLKAGIGDSGHMSPKDRKKKEAEVVLDLVKRFTWERQGRKNPWHEAFDDVMFYL